MTTKQKNILLISIISIVFLLAYGSLFKFHLVSDAYRIIDSSNEFIINLKYNEGRLFQVLYFSLLNVLHVSINSVHIYMLIYRINLGVSILLLVLCGIFTYKIFVGKMNNITKQKKVAVLICILLMFVNLSVAEYMLYFENMIIILGLLFSIIALYVYMDNKKLKYITTPFLILMSSLCYQGVTQIFVTLAALALFISKPGRKQSYYLKEVLKIFILYMVPLIINYLICLWLNATLPNIDPRIFTGVWQSLVQLISVKNILALFIYMLIVLGVGIVNSKIFTESKSKEVGSCFILLIGLAIISFEVFLFNNSVGLVFRTMLNYIIIYPILKIYIINLKDNNKQVIDIVITGTVLVLNILLVVSLQVVHVNSTAQNINAVEKIVEKINEYEEQTNIIIKNVAFYSDSHLDYEYWNAKYPMFWSYTVPIYYGYWCNVYSINVLSGKNYNRIDDSEVDINLKHGFKLKDWKELNIKEQVVFKDDTVHICCF